MTEAQLQSGIEQAAKALGFLTYHTRYALGSAPGFPDLVIVGYGELLFWECKGPRGRVSEAQSAWITELRQAHVHATVVTPDDYDWALGCLQQIYQRRAA